MSRKAGFGVFTLLICLVGGPWDGPPMRAFVTPVPPMPTLAWVPLEPMPPVDRPRLVLDDDVEPASAAEAAALSLRRSASVTRPSAVRVVHTPARRGAKDGTRATPRKSPYAIGKRHYPYVRPREWPPGYPVS